MQMVRRTFGLTLLVVSVLGLGVMSSAAAEEPKVDVVAEVVHASDTGSTVDPPTLEPMRDAFNKSGIHYKSFRRLSREKLTLRKGQSAELHLPNNVTASLTLKSVEHDAAKVQVAVPPVDTTYTLGREGSVFIQAGTHNGGMLILVLSPVPH